MLKFENCLWPLSPTNKSLSIMQIWDYDITHSLGEYSYWKRKWKLDYVLKKEIDVVIKFQDLLFFLNECLQITGAWGMDFVSSSPPPFSLLYSVSTFRLIQYRRVVSVEKNVDTEYTYYSWCMTSTDIVKWRKRNGYENFEKRGGVSWKGEEGTKSMPHAPVLQIRN